MNAGAINHLLITQSALVGAGNVKLHRSLGMWGIAHATAIMIFGLMLQLIACATRRPSRCCGPRFTGG